MRKVSGAATMTVIVLGSLLLSRCSSGPSTQSEVCKTFDELGLQILQGNGIIGNPLFHKAEELSGIVKRYDGADLAEDAAALRKIADSDSTNSAELMNATTHIAALCGHALMR
jgi:hypothetical protein